MCGIVGIAGVMPVNQSIYDALTVLQHRGQDAAGIITIDANNCFRLRKANGLVSDVFEARHMQRLQGNMGIGHVRYPTAGSSSASEAQPFYVNSPYGITLAHNGNLTNAHELRKKLFEEKRRHINTTSDSEILLNIFASELDNFRHYPLEADNIFAAIAATNRLIRGAYACVAMIIGHGMVAFRDPNGIRPLVLGKRDIDENRTEYMVASESVALDTLGLVPDDELRFRKYEGYLFPDTYEFYTNMNPKEVVKKFFDNFDRKVDTEVMQEIRNLSNGLGELDNLITLASIIQKEATDLENMKMVSSVFHNRLNNSSTYPYLQSDATTNYIRDDIRSFMTQDNQEMYDAYDTTKVVGLPVGPICNPGMDAIEAAIHPADTNYYYFVSDDAGTYYFAATLEEHEANIRKANQVNEQLKSEAAVEETGE